MSKTKIDWADYSINPVKGICPVGCEYCYARKLYHRFKWNPEISFDPIVFDAMPEPGAKVFVGSTVNH